MYLLETKQLRKTYKGRNVVDTVSLNISRGEIVGLLGPNGAGKTTLLLTMSGFLPPQEGKVSIDGKPLKAGRPHQASKAGMVLVPDKRNLFTTLTVEENLRAARHHGGPSPKDMLDVFPALEKRWTLRAGALSGGEQQMLAMARILRTGAHLLLLDEITEGLAPVIVQTLGRIIVKLKERGFTIVLVEQNFRFAAPLADRHYVMEHGRIAESFPAAELAAKTEMLHEYLGV